MRVFLDTNIVIYFVENTAGFGPRAIRQIGNFRAAGHTFAISDLVCLECLVLPTRRNDRALIANFDNFFTGKDVVIYPLTTAVCQRATLVRATYNFKTADALQLAAAIVHGCDRFLTADGRLSRCSDIPVDVLP